MRIATGGPRKSKIRLLAAATASELPPIRTKGSQEWGIISNLSENIGTFLSSRSFFEPPRPKDFGARFMHDLRMDLLFAPPSQTQSYKVEEVE